MPYSEICSYHPLGYYSYCSKRFNLGGAPDNFQRRERVILSIGSSREAFRRHVKFSVAVVERLPSYGI